MQYKVFDTEQEYNTFTHNGQKLVAGTLYIIKDIKSLFFYTNNIDGTDERYDYLDEIPEGYIIPDGDKVIIANGEEIDVSEYATVTVNVPVPEGYIIPSGNKNITSNGTDIDVSSYNTATVNVPYDLTTDTFTANGTYTPTNAEGYSSVTVDVPPVSTDGDLIDLIERDITSVDIDNSITTICSCAFYGCSGLTDVTIGSSVTSIGSNAFQNCSGLTGVTIPDSVTSIGYAAFKACSGLTGITVLATTPPRVGSYVFDNTNNCPIYVPAASLSAYQSASGWSGYASRILPLSEFVVVSEFSDYTQTIADRVFVTSVGKWYKKNNLDQYEEYGVYDTTISGTYYDGKLAVVGNIEYQYTNGSWVNVGTVSGSTYPIEYVPIDKPEGVVSFESTADMASYTDAYVGQGAVIYTPPINKIYSPEYIERTSTYNGYIPLGVKFTENTRVQIKHQQTNVQGDGFICDNKTSDSNDWRVFWAVGTLYYDFISDRISTYSVSSSSLYEWEIGNYYIKDLITNNTILSGTAKSGFTRYNNMFLYHSDGEPLTSIRDMGKIYYVKIYEGNTLVKDYIPWTDNAGTYGMFDQVSQTIVPAEGASMTGSSNVTEITPSVPIPGKTTYYKYTSNYRWEKVTSFSNELAFESEQNNVFSNSSEPFEVSYDGGTTWFKTDGSTLSVAARSKILVSCTRSTTTPFTSVADFNVSGNILSAAFGHNYASHTAFDNNATVQYLFANNTHLLSAKDMILDVTTLGANCYSHLFDGCSNLNYITCYATDISASNCTDSWVNGVAASGTFVKNTAMTNWTTGTSGVPSGWTVVDNS